jgi:hypothetical protein
VPKLYIAEPEGEAVYEIFESEVSLGRGAANGIQIPDSGASKTHALVRQLYGHWKIIDLESKNGLRVNGRFRNQHWLRDGDQLLIGTTSLRYAAEGAAEGSPAAAAAAAPAAAPARAAAQARPARPAAAAVPAAPAAPAFTPAAPAVPTPAFPPAAPAPAPARARATAGRARARYDDDDGYDSEYDDLPPPRRRSTNSGSIVVIGIISAVALIGLFWFLASGGTPHNQLVWKHAAKMADQRDYEGALVYAEKNGDPDGTDYGTLVRAMTDWKKRARAEKEVKRAQEAQRFYDYEIFRRQAIEGVGFRAKDALSDEEIVGRLREFLVKFKGTPTANELLNAEHSGYPALREAMRYYASPELKSETVLGIAQTELSILESKGQYGQVVMDLAYLRDMNRLIMTAENWKVLRNQVDNQIEEVSSKARTAFENDRTDFRKFNRNGERGKVLRILSQMREKYNGIPELMRGIVELESEIR